MNETIKKYLSLGYSVIPIVPKEKKPSVFWTPFQTAKATEIEAADWNPPIALIAGKVSGGLIALDFDDHGSRFPLWMPMVYDRNIDLHNKLVVQQTPSGGFHVLYRCPESDLRNTVLAELNENNEDGKSVLIETRANGGYFLVDPSPGYVFLQGSLETIPTITIQEHDLLISLSRSFNLKVKQEKKIDPKISEGFSISPLDDYDSKNTPLDLLKSHGWEVESEKGDVFLLKRPGKKDQGISATWNYIPNRFHVFSSNASPFEQGGTYRPCAVYAFLEVGGDFIKAASQLSRQGYGTFTKVETLNDISPKIGSVLGYVTVQDIEPEIDDIFKNGLPKGFKTGFPGLDQFYQVVKGHLNIITGQPTSGKSEVMDMILAGLAEDHGWNFIVFSPENHPIALHFYKIAERLIGKSRDNMSKEELEKAKKFVGDHFFFIPSTDEGISIENLFSTVLELRKTKQVDGLLIDPWNEIENSRPKTMSEVEFLGVSLSRIRKFSRGNKIATWIVAHPAKPTKEKKTGEYPVPDLYSISGGAMFYNKCDNGLIVHRNFADDYTTVIVKKIKFKYYGTLGETHVRYDTNSGRYYKYSPVAISLPPTNSGDY